MYRAIPIVAKTSSPLLKLNRRRQTVSPLKCIVDLDHHLHFFLYSDFGSFPKFPWVVSCYCGHQSIFCRSFFENTSFYSLRWPRHKLKFVYLHDFRTPVGRVDLFLYCCQRIAPPLPEYRHNMITTTFLPSTSICYILSKFLKLCMYNVFDSECISKCTFSVFVCINVCNLECLYV